VAAEEITQMFGPESRPDAPARQGRVIFFIPTPKVLNAAPKLKPHKSNKQDLKRVFQLRSIEHVYAVIGSSELATASKDGKTLAKKEETLEQIKAILDNEWTAQQWNAAIE
jgi:hypothetical protein